MDITKKITGSIETALAEMGVTGVLVHLEHPADMEFGDYSTNIALLASKQAKQNPHSLAEAIVARMQKVPDIDIASITVAGPGFINFRLTEEFFLRGIQHLLEQGDQFGKGTSLAGKKIIIEYTDPNPFKEFHIGHLLPNTIGESLARLLEASGGEVKRANYQGDVGMQIAMAIYGLQRLEESAKKDGTEFSLETLTPSLLGIAYAKGAQAYKDDEEAKIKITRLNTHIYARDDAVLNEWYDAGRKVSLQYFEALYQRLGTRFDFYFFESNTALTGLEVVKRGLVQGVFVESNGAVIFPGDKYGLHARVFINGEGLPTYEAKELGLALMKWESCPLREYPWGPIISTVEFPYDLSFVVTGSEIVDYFKVLRKAIELVYDDLPLSARTHHVPHGMLRLKTGKMSSRTGEVITAVDLISDAKEVVREKIDTRIVATEDERELLAEQIAIGAIKFAIIRQQVGRDMVFDFTESLAFDGDSGPYLQYTCARLSSLIRKAQASGIESSLGGSHPPIGVLEKLLLRFPDVVARAGMERTPHYLATYAIDVAREFNAFYAKTTIIDATPDAPYKVALVHATLYTLQNALRLMGIPVPPRM